MKLMGATTHLKKCRACVSPILGFSATLSWLLLLLWGRYGFPEFVGGISYLWFYFGFYGKML